MLTDSPLIIGVGIFSVEETLDVATSACAKETRCTVLGGGGTTDADAIWETGGADSSACQSNGMAAALRKEGLSKPSLKCYVKLIY